MAHKARLFNSILQFWSVDTASYVIDADHSQEIESNEMNTPHLGAAKGAEERVREKWKERNVGEVKGTINMRSLVFNELQWVFSSLKSLKCLLCHFSALHTKIIFTLSQSALYLSRMKSNALQRREREIRAFPILHFQSSDNKKSRREWKSLLISMKISHTQAHYKGFYVCVRVCVTRKEKLMYTLQENQ